MKIILTIMLFLFSTVNVSNAAYPGDCTATVVKIGATDRHGAYGSWEISSTGTIVGTGGYSTQNGATFYNVYHFYYQLGSWYLKSSGGQWYMEKGPGQTIPSSVNTSTSEVHQYLSCTQDECAPKEGQPGAPIYTGLPYDAQYYETAGICDDGCVAKPANGPTLNSYANDGSGYIIGPWTYTGDQCEVGVTPELPPQPEPEEGCEAANNACQAKCQGRAFQADCNTGACECFGAPPSTEDPPLDPTVPTADPGAPSVPGAQTPTTDPGGDAQLGAQIANQGKQLAQGDAQLAQLGAINNKLGAVISNQGKQLGQGDTIIDYQRRQLGVQEDIANKLEELTGGDVPPLPGVLDPDSSIPDTKDWDEHDDPVAEGQEQGQKQINLIEQSQMESPFSLTLNTSGANPCLSGPLLGTTIDICFNRPWMLTGYSIMQGILISIAYLQAFLMVNRTVTGGK